MGVHSEAQGVLKESPEGACPSGEDGQACKRALILTGGRLDSLWLRGRNSIGVR